MIKSKFKRVTSLFLAILMCVTTFAGIGSTTAYAASGEKADVYMVDFPRDGDANYDGVWGHSNLTLKNGWHTGRSNFTNLKAIGSYSGNVAYCIEPGISLKVGQTMNKYDENYFNNLAANGVISGDEIRLFVGRILQYGYRGTISTSWRSQNEAAANSIAQAYATQLLIWETVIGERDANFNHVAASGCSNVKDVINAKHPLRNKIFSYYNSMVQSVQNHATIPSFCNKSSGSAKTIELEWNGSKYTTTLTDSNNVLSKQKFASQIMTSKSPVRSAEDIDETALSYAEIKMLATGNPYIKEKMDLDIQVQKLKMLKSNFLSEKYGLEDKVIKFYPQQIAYLKSRVEGLTKDVETAKLHPKPIDEQPLGMMVSGVSYSEKAEAGQAIINACKSMNSPDAIPLGEYRGFQMER